MEFRSQQGSGRVVDLGSLRNPVTTTWPELEAQAAGLAQILDSTLPPGPLLCVGHNSLPLLRGILAAWLSRRAVLVIAPSVPRHRLESFQQAVGAAAILSSGRDIPVTPHSVPHLCLDDLGHRPGEGDVADVLRDGDPVILVTY